MTTKYYCGGIRDVHGAFYVEELEGMLYDYNAHEDLATLVTPRGVYELKLLGDTPREAVEKLLALAKERQEQLTAQILELQEQIRVRARELEAVQTVARAPTTHTVSKLW